MEEDSTMVRDLLERRERDYLMAKTRVTMRSSLENIDAGDFKLDSLKEGESVELPRWAAEELVRMDMAEAPEDSYETEIVKVLSREKMMGPLQISPLPPDFYVRMRRRLAFLDSAAKEGKVRREEYERTRESSYDLIGMRLSKLLSLSSTSATDSSFGDKLSPEEKAFFSTSQTLSKEWKEAMLGGAT